MWNIPYLSQMNTSSFSENLVAKVLDHSPQPGSSICSISNGLAHCFPGGPGGAQLQVSVLPGL
jgi:hypothetical protein